MGGGLKYEFPRNLARIAREQGMFKVDNVTSKLFGRNSQGVCTADWKSGDGKFNLTDVKVNTKEMEVYVVGQAMVLAAVPKVYEMIHAPVLSMMTGITTQNKEMI